MSSDDAPVGPRDWCGVALLVLAGLLAGLLETLLVPLYAGSVIVPVAVVLAVASNIALPTLARMLVPRTSAAALPFLAWLVVVIGFGTITRPEGDVILPGAPDGAKWVTYGMLLLGAVAGAGTLLRQSTPPRVAPTPPPPPRAQRRRVSR